MLPATIKSRALTQAMMQPLPKYFNQEEVKTILSDELRQEDYKTWFLSLFLWQTGMRVSEALSVKVEDIDLMGKALKVKTLKRQNHMRVIPLQNGFVGEISLWINQQELKRKDPLFSFNRITAFNKVRKACKLAGLDVTYSEVDSTYGHDAFLLETEQETLLIRFFLEKVSRGEVTEAYEI